MLGTDISASTGENERRMLYEVLVRNESQRDAGAKSLSDLEPKLAPVRERGTIRVFDDIHDPLVRTGSGFRKRRIASPDALRWCEPWWRLRSGKYQLHIVALRTQTRRSSGSRALHRAAVRPARSAAHFRPLRRFLLLSGRRGRTSQPDLRRDYCMQQFSAWRVVHLFNVNNKSPTSASLIGRGFSTTR